MDDMYKEIISCEVCDSTFMSSVLDLGMHPLCDDLININESRECVEFPIEILYCTNCNTAHQRYQISKEYLFPSSYHYRARFTSDVINGMKDLVLSCKEAVGNLKDKVILDVGCNDGSLLNFFKDEGSQTIGIEPTGAYIDAKDNKHEVYNEYFSEKIATKILDLHGSPDIITFTNVFAHIDDLKEVIRSLKILISKKTLVVIENHYLGSILKKNQFDTFYHEHPRSYSYSSFLYIAKSLGLNISKCEFPSRYGGNIRVTLGSDENSFTDNDLILNENNFINIFKNMEDNIKNWKERKKNLLNNLFNKFGKLRAKAFPGRAAILVKLLNLSEHNIKNSFEKPGSLKINHFIPGSKISIVSDEELSLDLDDNSPILNLAWHIPDEINEYLRRAGFKGEIINIIDNNDFIN